MRSNQFRHFLGRATTEWTGNWQLWLIALAVWLTNSTLSLGAFSDSENYLPAAFANVCSGASVLLLVAVWRLCLRRCAGKIRIGAVIGAGILIGIAKGLTTFQLYWFLTGQRVGVDGLITALLSPVIYGVFIIVGIGIVGSVWSDYNREREMLISARVSSSLHKELSLVNLPELSNLISSARSQVDSPSASADEVVKTLTHIAQIDVRTSSHRLWQSETERLGQFTAFDLVRRVILQHTFPIALLAPVLLIAFWGYQSTQYSFGVGIGMSVLQVVILLAILATGPLFTTRRPLTSLLVFLGLPAIALASTLLPPLVLLGEGVTDKNIRIVFITYVGTTLLSIALEMVMLARHSHQQIVSELTDFFGDGIDTEAGLIIKEVTQRNLARYLHGYVQNFILRASMQVSQDPDSVKFVIQDIEQMWQKLESGRFNSVPLFASHEEMCSYLTEMWNGVTAVKFSGDISHPLSDEEMDKLYSVCLELIANANRHGGATRIDIVITHDHNHMNIVARDNGSGPQGGKPGLGAALLDVYSEHNWTIQTPENNHGTVVTTTIVTKA